MGWVPFELGWTHLFDPDGRQRPRAHFRPVDRPVSATRNTQTVGHDFRVRQQIVRARRDAARGARCPGATSPPARRGRSRRRGDPGVPDERAPRRPPGRIPRDRHPAFRPRPVLPSGRPVRRLVPSSRDVTGRVGWTTWGESHDDASADRAPVRDGRGRGALGLGRARDGRRGRMSRGWPTTSASSRWRSTSSTPGSGTCCSRTWTATRRSTSSRSTTGARGSTCSSAARRRTAIPPPGCSRTRPMRSPATGGCGS